MKVCLHARQDEIARLRQAGLTYAEIGSRLGISKERVRQIVKGRPITIKPTLDSKLMLATRDVGQLLGVHVNTVRRWCDHGVLPAYRIGSRGDRRFRREVIVRFLEDGQNESEEK